MTYDEVPPFPLSHYVFPIERFEHWVATQRDRVWSVEEAERESGVRVRQDRLARMWARGDVEHVDGPPVKGDYAALAGRYRGTPRILTSVDITVQGEKKMEKKLVRILLDALLSPGEEADEEAVEEAGEDCEGDPAATKIVEEANQAAMKAARRVLGEDPLCLIVVGKCSCRHCGKMVPGFAISCAPDDLVAMGEAIVDAGRTMIARGFVPEGSLLDGLIKFDFDGKKLRG